MLTKKPVHRTDAAHADHRTIQDEQHAQHRFAPDAPAIEPPSETEYAAPHQPLIAQPTINNPLQAQAPIPQRLLLWAMVICTIMGATVMAGGFLAFGQSDQPAIVLHPPPTALPTATPAPAATPAPITVFVIGAVQQPGLLELPADSRVGDAIQQAGGLLPDADELQVNQATKLSDGAQVYIPFIKPLGETDAEPVEEPPPGVSGVLLVAPGSGASSANSGGLININTATQAELETLSGVGPTTAENIIAARPYSSIDDLERATGIGQKTVEKLRDLVTVE